MYWLPKCSPENLLAGLRKRNNRTDMQPRWNALYVVFVSTDVVTVNSFATAASALISVDHGAAIWVDGPRNSDLFWTGGLPRALSSGEVERTCLSSETNYDRMWWLCDAVTWLPNDGNGNESERKEKRWEKERMKNGNDLMENEGVKMSNESLSSNSLCSRPEGRAGIQGPIVSPEPMSGWTHG